MTIYGTPGGTPLNNTGFQGTQPGNPVQAGLQVANPGVGLFPPGSNNSSGDSVLAAASRAACPINVHINNFGVTASSGLGTGAQGGRTIAESLSVGEANGTNATFVNNGGSANAGPAGGNSFGAGGQNQTNGPGSGESMQIPASGPAATVILPNLPAQPVYRG